MRILLSCIAASLLAASAFAGEATTPKDLLPDQAAEKALAEIETALATGNIGWWRSEADPAIQFTAKYTGLGGDAVTALTLNQADKLWPAWKSVSEGMDNFGAACVVYNCLKYSYDGQYNKAALEGMKWYLVNRLKQVGEHGAISASGVGLIDFALNSFADAAMQQIKDDYWVYYSQYQLERHPHLRDYARLIKDGDGKQKGFPALAASLDTFWETPEAQAIRGFYTLSVQEPDYVATFRNRFIKQHVLAFLLQWAEHEQEQARITAWLAAKKYTEQVQATTFVLEVPVRERGLNDAPAGLTADLLVEEPGAKDNMRLLVSAPVTRDLKFEVPLSALFNDKKAMSPRVIVRLHREGPPNPNTAPQPDIFEIYFKEYGEANAQWKRDAQPGRLIYRPRDPLQVVNFSEVRVQGGSTGPGKIYEVWFHPLPSPGTAGLHESSFRPADYRCSLTDGKGMTRLANGRYLVVSKPSLAAETVITVKGDMDVAVAASAGGEATAPAVPDPARFREMTRKAAAAVRNRTSRASEAAADSVDARAAWWQAVLTALSGRDRAVILTEIKRDADARRSGITNAEQAAIIIAAQTKIAEIRKGTAAAEAAIEKALTEARSEAEAVELEQATRHQEITKEYVASRKEVEEILAKLRAVLTPTESSFVVATSGVTQGYYYTLSAMSGTTEGKAYNLTGPEVAVNQLEKARQGLAQIEQNVPQIAGERAKLLAAAERYARARAAVRDVDERDGNRIRVGSPVSNEEINATETRAEILGDPKVVAETRDLVKRGERMVERRKEHWRRVEAGVRRIEETGAAMPAVDAALWKTRTAEFAQVAIPLFDAVQAPGGAEDTPAWQKLAGTMDDFFREQIEVCGDLLEAPDKKETPFSRYLTAFKDLMELGTGADSPPDFEARRAPAAKKSGARNSAVAPALKIRRDVRLWLATGRTRAERSAALTRTLELLGTKLEGRGVEERLAAVQEKTRLLENLPSRLPKPETRSALIKRLDAGRAALASSGEVEEAWRATGEPFVVIATVNGKPFDRAFYRVVEETHRLPNNASPEAVLKVVGIAEGTSFLLRRSDDNGKTWYSILSVRGKYTTRLPIGQTTGKPKIFFKALLPGKKETKWFEGMPNYFLP